MSEFLISTRNDQLWLNVFDHFSGDILALYVAIDKDLTKLLGEPVYKYIVFSKPLYLLMASGHLRQN